MHEYEGVFQGRPAHFKMTSVIGHVLNIDFPASFQSWETTDPATLFAAPTVMSEANPKARQPTLFFLRVFTMSPYLSGPPPLP